MTFDSRSVERLRKLGRQLPQELPKPKAKNKHTANDKCHSIETEQNPQVLFQELMNTSPDGNVPKHLLERLKEIEATQISQNNSHKSTQTKNPSKTPAKKQPLKQETEEELLYASFESFLLEDED